MNLCPTMALFFTLIASIFCQIIPRNLIFSHISVKTILLSHFLTIMILTPIKPFLLTHLNMNVTPLSKLLFHASLLKPLHSPKQFYILSYYRNISPSTPLKDNLHDTFNSTESDSEMHQNPIYHFTSSPHFYPRVADSPNFSFESLPDPQALPTHFRAPHSPYKLRLLRPQGYHDSKPAISFPPLILLSILNYYSRQTLVELSFVSRHNFA